MGCSRCDTIPEAIAGDGQLLLWFPIEHAAAKVRAALEQKAVPFDWTDGCLRLSGTGLDGAVALAAAALTGDERKATRALLLSSGESVGVAQISRLRSLHELDVLARSAWLLTLLREERLVSHFHAIVDARDTSRVFAHEALLRGVEQDGTLVPPLRILELARDADLLFQVDLAARRSAIRGAARFPGTSVFVNFSPVSIYDPESCLRTTIKLVDELGLSHDRLVFEVIEADRIGDAAHLQRILDYYRSQGFRVALDDLGAGWSTLSLVHTLRPDFIKLDRELVRGVENDPVKQVIAGKLLEMARDLGIRTVVEGVETEAELGWARTHGADYVQGFLLGRPQPEPQREVRRIAP